MKKLMTALFATGALLSGPALASDYSYSERVMTGSVDTEAMGTITVTIPVQQFFPTLEGADGNTQARTAVVYTHVWGQRNRGDDRNLIKADGLSNLGDRFNISCAKGKVKVTANANGLPNHNYNSFVTTRKGVSKGGWNHCSYSLGKGGSKGKGSFKLELK